MINQRGGYDPPMSRRPDIELPDHVATYVETHAAEIADAAQADRDAAASLIALRYADNGVELSTANMARYRALRQRRSPDAESIAADLLASWAAR
jgi:hypothetical protein